jgi:hypothetical protein
MALKSPLLCGLGHVCGQQRKVTCFQICAAYADLAAHHCQRDTFTGFTSDPGFATSHSRTSK